MPSEAPKIWLDKINQGILRGKYFTSDTFKVKVNMIVILYKILMQPKSKKDMVNDMNFREKTTMMQSRDESTTKGTTTTTAQITATLSLCGPQS